MTARIRIQTLCAVAALAVTGLSASFISLRRSFAR